MRYASADALDFALSDLPTRPNETRVLMTTPDHFEIVYVINAHMEGMEGSVDQARAGEQWRQVKAAYERIGFAVDVIAGQPGLPDMVFCANQTLPIIGRDGGPHVLLSQMGTTERAPEVPFYRDWFETQGYTPHALPPLQTGFEGAGDALWHPDRRLLWGGWGFRTDAKAYDFLTELTGVPHLHARTARPRVLSPGHVPEPARRVDGALHAIGLHAGRTGPAARRHPPSHRSRRARVADAVRLQRALPRPPPRADPDRMHDHERTAAQGRVRGRRRSTRRSSSRRADRSSA